MVIIDSHCHLDLPAFEHDRNVVLASAKAKNVRGFVVPAIKYEGWQSLIELCNHYPELFYALGLHPMFAEQHSDDHLAQLEAWVKKYDPVAIGEIGLDFYLPDANQVLQQSLLESQLVVATNTGLPVILHVRKAHEQVLSLLKSSGVRSGICHAFNGSIQQARRYIDLGFKLGFGGMLTYPRSSKLRRLAKDLPLDCMVLETDAPDMPGIRHQYHRNSPEYLVEVVDVLVEICGESAVEIARQTTTNVCDIFPPLAARL
jgi:TatD DNase family protein